MKLLTNLAFTSTGIGSMPHKTPEDAVNFLSKTFKDILVWPQLPKVSHLEDMTFQYSEKLPGLVYDKNNNKLFFDTNSDEYFMQLEEFFIDYESIIEGEELELLEKYAITNEYCSAFDIWLETAKKNQPKALKGQVTGPFTYATSLTDQDNKCAFYDETLKELIEKFLSLKALWQIKKFKEACPNAQYIISLDEPSISQYGSSAFLTVQKNDIINSLNSVADTIHKFGGTSFTHCCGNTDWSIVTSSNVQMLNFDAYNFSDSFCLYPENINAFLNRGGMIAWGLVPTLDEDQLKSVDINKLTDHFINIKDDLCSKGVDENKLLNQSIITPACGTGSLSIDLAEKSMNLTTELALLLRSKFIN